MKTSGFQDLDIDLNADGVIKSKNSVVEVDYENFADAAENNEGFAKLLKALNLKGVKKTALTVAAGLPFIGDAMEAYGAYGTLTTPEDKFVDPTLTSKVGRATVDVIDPTLGVAGQAFFPKKDDTLQKAAGAVAEPFVQAEQGFIKKALSQITSN